MEGSESEASSEVRAAVGEGEVKDSDAGEAAAKVEYGPARREDVVNQDWESDCPLFMTKLPQDMEENPELLGLQNIMYGEEGEQATPLQLAENMKERGNDYFREGPRFYPRALECYTNAIKEPVEGENEKRAVYFSNRAAVHIKLENYGHAVEDCKDAIKLNSDNLKAHYRGAQASIKLRKWDQALEFITSGLQVDQSHKELLKMQASTQTKLDEHLASEAKRLKKERAEERKRKALQNAIASRGITMGKKLFDVNFQYEGDVGWADGIPASGTLVWPVLFLYPEYKQSDFIQAMSENDVLQHHLEVMFPSGGCCEWDERKDYVASNLVLFFETNAVDVQGSDKTNYGDRRFKRVEGSKTLAEVLCMEGHVVPGFPVLYALPRRSDLIMKFLTGS